MDMKTLRFIGWLLPSFILLSLAFILSVMGHWMGASALAIAAILAPLLRKGWVWSAGRPHGLAGMGIGIGALLGFAMAAPLICMLLSVGSLDWYSWIWVVLNCPALLLGYGIGYLWSAVGLPRGGFDGWEPIIYSSVITITIQWSLVGWLVCVLFGTNNGSRTQMRSKGSRT